MNTHVTSITDPADERVRDYFSLTDVALRRLLEPERGLYIAESEKVIRRALGAGHRPRSFLMGERWLTDLADVVDDAAALGVPVYVAEASVIEQLTGFKLHRGALAAMHRPALPSYAEILRDAQRAIVVDHSRVGSSEPPAPEADPQVPSRSRIAVLEDLVDHTNVGAVFRSAAAMGVDGVLVTPRCADPLYRRAIRVSMGTVFQVPWTRIDPWPDGIEVLQEQGYVVAGMTLANDAITLDELVAQDHSRLALVFGTEGHGLSARTSAAVDLRVKIPMKGGVDSLNVAASSAVTFYATR
ncbi:TrmH family RNA methyltransferase [Leekyejoonella antrihumi]|uniref:RNA methyltransferase n=1 Tax=Leekyejoonella antrihumi TaxID=1660198 RepID=A0A563E3V8_9MICO|nr:RNA methyltransferase [Leekyejoonella antrihumi]TWP37206.1 RNA methyltransferase [Leekyejoonella antrihumi]